MQEKNNTFVFRKKKTIKKKKINKIIIINKKIKNKMIQYKSKNKIKLNAKFVNEFI